jgi:hypothetical protein
MTRVNAWFSEEKDCAGRRAAPLELKILGVLRVLGRGYCFDGIEELNFISAESNRIFFHLWCEMFTKKYFSIYCNPPETAEEIASTMAVYNRLGFQAVLEVLTVYILDGSVVLQESVFYTRGKKVILHCPMK